MKGNAGQTLSRIFPTDSVRQSYAVAGVFMACVVLAVVNRFIQDDAYISFRYAYNLVAGDGLVYNAGERVEGYTNFLWTLLMTIPMLFGRDAVIFSQVLGIICFIGTLLVVYRLAKLLFCSTLTSALAVLLLGANYTFSSYATGGLETQLQALLVVSGTYGSIRAVKHGSSVGRLALLSLVYAAALLSRLDSAAALVIPAVFLLVHLVREPRGTGLWLNRLVAFVLPGAAVIVVWLVWKYTYYGNLLPNSFYAKTSGGVTSLERGWWYIYNYFKSYWLYPFFLLVPFRFKILTVEAGGRIMAATLVLWLLYVIKVGGDFMEFRFMVPVMPLAMIFLAAMIVSLRNKAVVAVLTAGVIAGSISHQVTFDLENEVASIHRLRRFVLEEAPDWTGAGKTLGRLFKNYRTDVTIATTAAGAIPYYSHLTTIDMLGLNDKWVARNGVVLSTRPGHQKYAPFNYLLQRHVNLVIGHPQVRSVDARPRAVYSFHHIKEMFKLVNFNYNKISPRSCVVEIQINKTLIMRVLYLVPNAAVDDVIRREALRTYPIHRGR
jgi:arabinofuranosyltransferase